MGRIYYQYTVYRDGKPVYDNCKTYAPFTNKRKAEFWLRHWIKSYPQHGWELRTERQQAVR